MEAKANQDSTEREGKGRTAWVWGLLSRKLTREVAQGKPKSPAMFFLDAPEGLFRLAIGLEGPSP